MWKQHKYLSTHKWVKKIELYRCGAIKNEILPFEATWMDLEGIMPSEISQTEKGKCCMIPLIGGI